MTVLIKRKEVLSRCAISHSTLYRMINSGEFPKPINLGKRAVAWPETEVEDWIQERIELSHKRRG